MADNQDKIKKLYDTFVSDGYEMESEADFRKNLSDAKKRRAAYDALVNDGYEMESYDEFEANIGYAAPAGKAKGVKAPTPAMEASSPDTEGADVKTPSTQSKNGGGMSEQEKIRLALGAGGIAAMAKSDIKAFGGRINDALEYEKRGALSGYGTVDGGVKFDAGGEMKQTYITPAGNRYTDKQAADEESRRYRAAADMSIGGQLNRTRRRLADIDARLDARGRELLEEDEKNRKGGLGGFIRDMGRAMTEDKMGGATAENFEDRRMLDDDADYQALKLAKRKAEEEIKQLEDARTREEKGERFWRDFGKGAWREIAKGDAWDFGKGKLRDARTMLEINNKLERGEALTEAEENAMYEMYLHDAVMSQYGDLGTGYKWGGIAGNAFSYMKDFVITGGFEGFSMKLFPKAAAYFAKKAAEKAGVKAAESIGARVAKGGLFNFVRNGGKQAVGKLLAEQGVAGTAKILSTKVLGATADDLVRASLMTTTIQGQNTAAGIIDKKLGSVVADEDSGELRFANDETWGNAAWQTTADSVIENFSEMWGAHLPGMADVTKVFGARNLTAALLKSTREGAGTVLSKTSEFLKRAGVNGYFGEVGEEYYGQLWRSMLNLDTAYKENADGTRTNLMADGEFHGDIWGGMAMSVGMTGMGAMTVNYGAGKAVDGAKYAYYKHEINKADIKASEVFTPEVWNNMKLVIDASDNGGICDLAAQVVSDAEMNDEQRGAAMDYMEKSLMMRGNNLREYATKRDGGVQDADADELSSSYINGYNASTPQEMNDAKNLFEYHRKQVEDMTGGDFLAEADDDPIGVLERIKNDETWSAEAIEKVTDYLNAKQVRDGMIQGVRDDIDGRIEQSNAMIAARKHRDTGKIVGATMKQDDRKVYVVAGNVVTYEDGTGVSVADSDNSVIIRDAETGALEQVSPEAMLSIDEEQDAYEQQQLAADAIRVQVAQEAADKIDGVISFNPGDTYTIAGEDGNQAQVQVTTNEMGIVDNGDGTVNVTDGVNIFPLAKDVIQQSADAANIARVAEFEQQRAAENLEHKAAEQEAARPQYAMNDLVTLRDENGMGIRGNITADADADGRYEVYTEEPVNGRRVNLFTRDELDAMLMEHNGEAIEQAVPESVESVPMTAENAVNADESVPESVGEEQRPVSALQRIPQDKQGNPMYEQAETPDIAWDAIVEQTDGDEVMAQTVADGMVADKEAALKKIEKSKAKGGTTIAEKIAAEKERKAAIEEAKGALDIWKKIAQTAQRRKNAEESERHRIIEEQAAQRKAEEEKLRAEQEEAARIKREALNGVPDMADDTPQDARARGYRRVAGHKIDRQQPVKHLQGKEVEVKFSNDTLAKGRVAVIDASELQPSHIQGMRNPAHFIDEAQPKERNDEVSVMSARKIAGSIRPEEITTSVTAYTGAPTVNARGEVIQGNNRSDALRLMWNGEKEQAAVYKQYLKDHAEEFGLNAEEIDAMQSPVLVNMLDVEDADAITLGQFVAQDTESGGVERIKPKNAVQKMGAEMRSFANLLLRSTDDETSFAGLVDSNGDDVLRWMNHRGYITPTQYKSAFDSKGAMTAEAKNDLKGIMYQSIFQGGNTRLEEMFNAMPAKAQRAILSTAFRDYDSPNGERMMEEIQDSIRAYNALSQDEAFTSAKNWKEARTAVEVWKREYVMDDVTGESYLPAEKFSNFAMHLATMYKGESQGFIQSTFNRLYDLIQGTQEDNLFEKADNTPRTLVEAIKETLNIDYNGKQRSNVLAGDSSTSQQGRHGSDGNPAPRERVESGEQATDGGGRALSNDTERGGQGDVRHTERRQQRNMDEAEVAQRAEALNRIHEWLTDENIEWAKGKTRKEIFEHFGNDLEPVSVMPHAYIPLFGGDAKSNNVYSGKGYFIDHAANHHVNVPIEDYYNIQEIIDNPDSIKRTTSGSIAFIKKIDKFNAVLVDAELDSEGRILLHKSFFTQKKEPYAKEDDIRHENSSREGGVSSISHADDTAPAISLQSRHDVDVSAGKDNKTSAEKQRESEKTTLGERITAASENVNTEPTEAQKEAGNYKKGHVQVGAFDVTIEQPVGSVRRGTDANGKKWESKMYHTYGYIRGTEGVDGDHIDVFISADVDGWNGRKAFVVDQYNPDGSFDEHKVMLGFNDKDEAFDAYLSNYEKGWENGRRLDVTEVSIEDFEKWIDSSHRKTKPFAEYKGVKSAESATVSKTETNTQQDKTESKDGDEIRFRDGDEAIEAVAFARNHDVPTEYVKAYGEAMKQGNLSKASRAMKYIEYAIANRKEYASMKELVKAKKPVIDALKNEFGDVEELRAEYIRKKEEERGVMEAARKRAEEEQEAKRKREEELMALSEEEIDREYLRAISKGEEAKAREMLDEAARRKGYGDEDSDYQGVGGWSAPSDDGYTAEERRSRLDGDLNLEDIALGFSPARDDYFDDAHGYGYDNESGLESQHALKEAMAKVKRGGKATIKVYRTVPVTVKEGALRSGDWVTPSKKYAEMHGEHRFDGKFRIMEQEVPTSELWWDGNDIREWGYDDGKRYKHKNVKNNRKLADLVTKDDNGEIIPPSKRFDEQKDDVRYRFIGEEGAERLDRYEKFAKGEEAGTRLDNLGVARAMEYEEKDAKAIKIATGWERGADGKWRYETPDFEYYPKGDARKDENYKDSEWYKELAALSDKLFDGKELDETESKRFDELAAREEEIKERNNNAEHVYLDDYIKDDELFKAYPELKKTRLKFVDLPNDDFGGFYSYNEIIVNSAKSVDDESVIAHELQHAIQHIEGFATGGNPNDIVIEGVPRILCNYTSKQLHDASILRSMADKLVKDGKYVRIGNAIRNAHNFLKEKGWYSSVNNIEFDLDDDLPYIAHLYGAKELNEYSVILGQNGDSEKFKKYIRLAGEVEARNVEKRMGMSIEKRRSALAEETEDVAREDQIFLQEAMKGKAQASFADSRDEFENMRKRAVKENGIVAPNLADIEINTVKVSQHSFNGDKPISQAKAWAKNNIVGEHRMKDGGVYSISSRAVEKYLSRSAAEKSDNLGVHLSVLTKLPEVIAESVDAEIHPDYKKGKDGTRSVKNGVNMAGPLVHRMYGAAVIDRKVYRVKTTMHEYMPSEKGNKNAPHSFEVTKIELLPGLEGQPAGNPRNESNSIFVAKLLQGVEKSYDKGKKLLDESKPIVDDYNISFRDVENEAVLSEFAEGKTVKAYRTMQVIDGKLYSPMATKVGGKTTPEIKLGVPEQSEEHPEIIKGTKVGRDGVEQGYVVIDKGLGKGSLTVAYNPYAHTSRTVLNDQFSSAYIRPNLVTVEVEVPESELTSGYRAPMAKDAVGEISWHSGSVSGQLADLGKPRRVILTRYDKPVRIVPYREVAQMIAEQLDGTDIAIPYNVVQPQLRSELERLGVTISEEVTGSIGEEPDFGRAEYITDQEIERINAHQQEMAKTSPEAKSSHAEKLSKKFNTPIRIVNDVNELTSDNSEREARMRKSKGFYDTKTGEVVVVVPNNANVDDVAETVFHEVVAHKGLRELIGAGNYDAFCDEIYGHLKDDLKRQVDEDATRRFMNEPGSEYQHQRRVAVDELLARMAEKGFEDFTKAERGIWAKLKIKVLEAINKFLGSLKLPKWVKLGDNELRYMLWRSHENLRSKGDNAEMDKTVEAASDISTIEDEDELMRDGEGAYTDDEVSYENDAMAKVLGHSRRTVRQRREYARRERERMARRVESLAEKLHLDNVVVVTDVSELDGKKRKARGFYSKSSGMITIVIPNHTDTWDVEQTLLHEAVAHYGLRKLFGEHFDTFLDNVYEAADAEIRAKIANLASKNGWNFRTATEEYLASLAEKTNFENMNARWWDMIKRAFMRLLNKIGFEGFGGVTLTDNELRYILWRSYKNLSEPGEYRSILDEAADVAKQYELKVGNYSDVSVATDAIVAERADLREVNERFNEQLEKWDNGKLPARSILEVGYPTGVMKAFMPKLPIIVRQKVLRKSKKKHGLQAVDMSNLPHAISTPIFVFKSKEGTISVLTDLRDDSGRNLFVAVNLGSTQQSGGEFLEVNDITTIHGREVENVVLPIVENNSLQWADKKKGVHWLSSAKSNSQAIAAETLSSAAKVVESFENPKIEDENEVLYRDGEPEMLERAMARDKYERRVKSGLYQTTEAMLDSMAGVKEAMTAILGKRTKIEDVEGFENAYLGENTLSSLNQAEVEAFARLLFKPLLEVVAKLAKTTDRLEELNDYMMAKHGLERNKVMAERDAQKDFAEYRKQHPTGTKTLQDFADEYGQHDYAGLTALTRLEDVSDAEAEAQAMVDEYESAHDTTELWDNVNAVSKAILSKSYECGMMNKDTYESVSGMYEYYIPLRGFDEKTSAEAYAYLTHNKSAFNAPIKKANGRTSKADDPIATLQSMAESAIMQGNRNVLVKQKFLNFVLNHPSDLASVSDLWLQHDDVTNEWKPVFPDNIEVTDSPEEVEKKLQEFEERMKQLAAAEPDNYKHGKDAVNIPYRVVESRDLRQHQVVVKRNGRDYVITINGNPRAAQALNGLTNPDNDISGSIGQIIHLVGDVNRTLSAVYTTLQPDFVASNFVRDTVYSNSMVWVKESPKYALRYNANFAKLPIARMKRLLAKYRKGTLDMNDETEKMFYQFIMNGGETGFARMADIDEHKKKVKKFMKMANEKIPARAVRKYLTTWIGEVGRGIEMRARFAAFITSRNAGRSMLRSIWDAKEISVNFNKKGAGDKFLNAEGQTFAGNVAAGVSGVGRAGFIFWNAALQGTFGNFLKYAMRHPGKMSIMVASWYGMGLLITALASAGGDDDDDGYYDIPKHTRRQNLVIKASGNTWIKIPLPIEYRAVYAMGELTGAALFHNEKIEPDDVLAQMSQLLPIDLMEGGKSLWPSSVKPIVEVSGNENWYGRPIWKETSYNKHLPNWTKAYKSANKDLVNLSAALNEMSGGSKYRKGEIDLNPAAIEYLLKQYTGGYFTVANQIRNLTDVATGEKDFDWRYVPLANRVLMTGGDERNANKGLDEKFFRYMDAYAAKASEFSAIKGDMSLPVLKKAELISEIVEDEEYKKMRAASVGYSTLNHAYKIAKESGETNTAEELAKKIYDLKRNFISEMEKEEKKEERK